MKGENVIIAESNEPLMTTKSHDRNLDSHLDICQTAVLSTTLAA